MGSKCAHDSGLCACEAYGRPVVEEVRGATEAGIIVSGLLPEEFEEVDHLAMGEDVKAPIWVGELLHPGDILRSSGAICGNA